MKLLLDDKLANPIPPLLKPTAKIRYSLQISELKKEMTPVVTAKNWQLRPATSLGRDTNWVRQLQLSGYTNSGAVLPGVAGCIPLELALDRYAQECASLHHACHLHHDQQVVLNYSTVYFCLCVC